MKKRASIIAVVSIAVLSVAAVPFVYAGQGHPGHMQGMGEGMGPLGHLEKVQKEIGLSDQQVDQIKTIMAGVHEQNAAYHEQLRGGFQSIVSTLLKNPDDTVAAQAIIDQQSQAERAMKANLLAGASKALNILTPEQRQKLGTLISERAAQFHHRF